MTLKIQLEGYKCIPKGESSNGKRVLIIYLQDKFDFVYTSRLNNYNKELN